MSIESIIFFLDLRTQTEFKLYLPCLQILQTLTETTKRTILIINFKFQQNGTILAY